mmetsp:Transcript_37518/g.49436  ORF Transcript_37518/g.49436 Transcript_37518/m.49436 type:complete len:130 (+) Transcript_37518:311-700(+)
MRSFVGATVCVTVGSLESAGVAAVGVLPWVELRVRRLLGVPDGAEVGATEGNTVDKVVFCSTLISLITIPVVFAKLSANDPEEAAASRVEVRFAAAAAVMPPVISSSNMYEMEGEDEESSVGAGVEEET